MAAFAIDDGQRALAALLRAHGARVAVTPLVRRAVLALRRGKLCALSARAPLHPDDALLLPDAHGALLGVGIASSRLAAPELARFASGPVQQVELIDPELPRLADALALLGDDTVLVAEGALAQPPVHFARVLRVPRLEALRGALRLLECDGTLFVPRAAPLTRAALARLDWRVIALDAPARAQSLVELEVLEAELVRGPQPQP